MLARLTHLRGRRYIFQLTQFSHATHQKSCDQFYPYWDFSVTDSQSLLQRVQTSAGNCSHRFLHLYTVYWTLVVAERDTQNTIRIVYTFHLPMTGDLMPEYLPYVMLNLGNLRSFFFQQSVFFVWVTSPFRLLFQQTSTPHGIITLSHFLIPEHLSIQRSTYPQVGLSVSIYINIFFHNNPE